MGQRLVVSVIENSERIAALYYHWSAYSQSALWEAQRIINFIDQYDGDDLRLGLIHFCENNGGVIDGGKDSEEFKAIQKMYPNEIFKENGNRNEGLIALTEAGMADLDSWSEGDIEIDLDREMVYNSVYCEETLEEYNSWQDKEFSLDDFEEIDINLGEIKFTNLGEITDKLDNLPFTFKNHEGTIIELIA